MKHIVWSEIHGHWFIESTHKLLAAFKTKEEVIDYLQKHNYREYKWHK